MLMEMFCMCFGVNPGCNVVLPRDLVSQDTLGSRNLMGKSVCGVLGENMRSFTAVYECTVISN